MAKRCGANDLSSYRTKRMESKADRQQAVLDAQREAREADPRPSEEIVREMRDEWRDND